MEKQNSGDPVGQPERGWFIIRGASSLVEWLSPEVCSASAALLFKSTTGNLSGSFGADFDPAEPALQPRLTLCVQYTTGKEEGD